MVKELRIALTVENYDEALAFYRDVLGMQLLDEWNTPTSNGALLEAGRATLEIFDEGQAAMVDDLEVGRRVAGTVRFAVEVDDSAGVAEQLEQAGAQRLGGPVETPWGDVNVRLEAPDGMQLTLFTPSGA
ncbi:MAG TPA: VOC family protein [Gaiellaceae bacterium]|jgi:methylmalonyl-CoA/ethylmalonyl-CoA epimerase|nr:VOC family protein [Gaiellaceae bacterium]